MDPYLYRRQDNDELVERIWEVGEKATHEDDDFCITLDNGVKAERDIKAEREREGEGRKDNRITMAYNRPLSSFAATLPSPGQAAKFNEEARAAGIAGVNYDMKTGECTFDSRGARNDEMKRRGLFDKDAGYGDKAD